MGLLSKLKGVFFEEEEVEEEEEKEREPKEKVSVAKKIETPEIRKREEEPDVAKEEKLDIEEDDGNTLEELRSDRDIFPRFDDKDFEVEKTIELDEPIREIPEEPKEEPVIEEEEYHYEEVRYEEPVRRTPEPTPYHGLYEGSREREAKQTFTPSPIISPIYGILNKNYKKEEIVTKKEVRLSQISAKKTDLDIVREKAYGDLAGDISLSIEEGNDGVDKEINTKEDLLYDLSEEQPKVKTVTVGDAEEYYNDLGLEYNVDYKVESEDKKITEEVPVEEEKETEKEENKIEIDEESDDKNIFDIIDSMYEDKEKE